jgi:transposase
MVQYIEGDNRIQSMLLPAAIDDYVSPASPVRAIDAFVDQLDLVASGFKTRTDSSEGRSSYDPATLLKLYLWGYLKRTRSSRGLETACAENLQAIWLTSNLRPDHSTIADFRKQHPAQLKSMLREFNLICFELRLFGKELVAIDGTFIKDRHGHGGLLCRGVALAGAEMGLSAWAYNFTRVINLIGIPPLLDWFQARQMAAQGC